MSESVTNFLGRTAEGDRIYVTITLEQHEPNDGSRTTNHQPIAAPYWRLSVTGTGIEKGHRDASFAGQILDDAARVENLSRSNFTAEDVQALLTIWREWHLNDMQAGCDHQVVVWEDAAYGRRPSLDLTPACPESGYKYGHSWLVKLLPDDVVIETRRLMAIPRGLG